ncbi:RND transporter, partial [Achromobacter xylosoxidans]
AGLPPFQAQQRTALYRLAALTGQTPAEIPTTLLQCAAAPQLSETIPVGDGAALLRRRPDIRQAERALAAATARIGVATADLYPKITLGLSGASGGPAAMFGDRGTFSWSVGPLISWTLPNTGAVQARIAEAEANTKAAVARFDASVLNALRETESALVVYARQLDRQAALQAARDQAAQAASQARQLFQYGKTDYLTVLDAERTLASNESALAAGQAELSNDQIAVFLALGGGWEK